MKIMTRRQAIQKGGRLCMGAAAGMLTPVLASGCSNPKPDRDAMENLMKKTALADIRNLKITVAYDNVSHDKNLRADWGFSCLVQGLDKTILFDTGRFDNHFMDNLARLGIDPGIVDELVISHDHPDHMGGALTFLESRPGITVSLVKSFGSTFKRDVQDKGARLAEIGQPALIAGQAVSTGEMKCAVRNEHSLVILTNKGVLVITGCAHPGVVEIVERAKDITQKEVLLVAGGFHLYRDYESSIQKVAESLKELGVGFVAPSHCTGPEAREIFAKVFGSKFIDSGVGRVISAGDLV